LLPEQVRASMAAALAEIQVDGGGGASLAKALMLGDLIAALPVRVAVEIGVYRGRLFLPLAIALAGSGGQIYGVDPYSADAAVQLDEHDVGMDLRSWPRSVDWDRLHSEVVQRIAQLGLGETCHLLRARSDEAIGTLRETSVDLLHLDGNHDAAAVAGDLRDYLPLVRPGGFLVLDDAGWDSVRPVYEFLRRHHELVFQIEDYHGVALDGVGGNDFAVFRIRGGAPGYRGAEAG
jgi:hypothetical protein